jgi:hypothetical protein
MRTHLALAAALAVALPGANDQSALAAPQAVPATWFTDHQAENGSWPTKTFAASCPQKAACVAGAGASDADTPAATSLVLMMLISIGHTRRIGPFAPRMKRGVKYLFDSQAKDGRIGDDSTDGRQLYNQALSVMALAESYGMDARPEGEQRPIQRAVDYLCAKQRKDGAWPYGPDPTKGDAALTVWALLALKSARLARLTIPDGCTDKAFTWLESVRGSDHLIGWRAKGDDGERPPGCRWITTRKALRAGVAAARLFYRFGRTDKPTVATADWMRLHLPTAEEPDAVFAYFGTLVMFRMGGGYWKDWRPAFDAAVPAKMQRTGPNCARGTWDPKDDPFGAEGGRTYTSAVNMLASTIARRFDPPKGK